MTQFSRDRKMHPRLYLTETETQRSSSGGATVEKSITDKSVMQTS